MTGELINKLSSLKLYLKKREIADYYYVIQDFETSSEKECAKMDTKNLERYNHLLKKATKAQKSIGNTGLSMNLEVPPPPMPNNRDRYNLWRRRNAVQKVIPQSDAIYFLTKEGYELNKDYEAYQAIGLTEQIMKEKGINKSNEDISKNFKNIYNENDRNLVRRFSVYGMNEFTKARKTASNRTIESLRQLENEEFERTRTQSLPNIVRQTDLEQSCAPFVQPTAPAQSIQNIQHIQHIEQNETSRSLTELYPKCEV